MENLFTADIGGNTANQLFQRLGDKATYTFENAVASIATNGRVLETDSNVLAIVGTPLPRPDRAPSNWREAAALLPSYDGFFSMLYWDRAAGKLVVVSDFLGCYPLYFKREPGRAYFSTATRAFGGDVDHAGWGAFITLGHTLGDTTLTGGVERVPPASVITVDLASADLEITRYWQSRPRSTPPTLNEVHDALRASTKQTIDAYGDEEHAVLMSGGFDSRLIACELSRLGCSIRGVLVSHYDENLDAETRFGKAMAKKLGFPCEYVAADRDFFSSSAFLDYLFHSDAEIPSLYLFISQVLQFVPPAVVWEGFIPGTILKNHITDASPTDHIEVAFKDYLRRFGKSFNSGEWNAARQLFKPEVAQQFQDAFQHQWDSLTAKYPNDEEGLSQFLFDHRNRNRTLINPFKAYRARAKTVTPGMTREFVELAQSIPEKAKRDNAVYKQLFDSFYPEANTVPIVQQIKLLPPKHFSPRFEAFKLFNRFHSELRGRPKLMRYLGMDPYRYRFRESALLRAPALFDDPDPALNHDFVRKLQSRSIVSPAAMKLLFHWRAWRWLHEQTLHERFSVDPLSESSSTQDVHASQRAGETGVTP